MPALDASDPQVRGYVCRYYWHLMTPEERLAYRHLFGTMKATHGRSDAIAQQEARNSKPQLRELFSDDPEVLHLASAGMEVFLEKTATRMLTEHRDEIIVNQCPKCGALARTPNARQCPSCHHDWHDRTEYP
jgi:rubrerythrin